MGEKANPSTIYITLAISVIIITAILTFVVLFLAFAIKALIESKITSFPFLLIKTPFYSVLLYSVNRKGEKYGNFCFSAKRTAFRKRIYAAMGCGKT